MFKRLLLPASCSAMLSIAWPAAATQYHWTGNAGTADWFTAGNWSKGSDPDPYPRGGDSPRIGVQANNFPAIWPRYNGTNVAGGVTPTDGAFLIAGVTNAQFYMDGGYLQHNSWVNIGNTWPFTGYWTQTGGVFDSSPWVRQFTVGAAGNGELVISGGAIQVDNFAIIRNSPGANPAPTNAWVLLTGLGRISCNSAYIGIYGTAATLTNQDNALFSVTNALTIGRNEGGIGHVYQEGGLVIAGSTTDPGVNLYTAGSEYVLSGGTLLASCIDSTYTNDGGAFVFDGGTLVAGGSSQRLIRRIGSVTINSGKTAFIDTAGFYERVQSGMTGGGGLTKLGAGTLVLEGTNSYAGATLVSTGAVLFAANQNLNAVTVSDGATIGTDIDLPDNQAALDSLTMGSGSTNFFNLYSGDSSPAPARMLLTNGLVLNGPVTILVTSSEVLSSNTLYNLLDYGTGISGSGSLALGPLPCGMVANLVTNGTVIGLYVTRGAALPAISTAPASQTVLENRSVTFSVTLTECAELAAYQWVFNGTNLIAGATSSSYTIPLAQLTDQGTYEVVITNAVGAVTSAPPAVLTVTADTVPPVPLSAVRPYAQSTNVFVAFDELLDQSSAETAGNYGLSNLTSSVDAGAPNTALLLADQKTVRLTFSSALSDNILYKLSVAGVKDLAQSTQPGASVLVTLYGVLQPTGPGRLVVMEAEDADEIVPSAAFDGNLRSWEVVWDRTGYSGWAALRCLPNYGQAGNPTGPEGPAARFVVDFPVGDAYPVTYYLWVRAAGETSDDDSCHATLDWQFPYAVQMPNLAQNFYQPTGGWGWASRSSQGGYGRAMLVVSNAGLHTVDILMREDGLYCDKLLMTTDSAYNPSTINGGLGPDEVTRPSMNPQIAFVSGTLVYNGSSFSVSLQTVAAVTNVVEHTDTLAPTSWATLTNFVGDGSIVTITDLGAPATPRYYRARFSTP
jgi:autotransporter-associated beta strand protein